ncbi:hypothetical protein ACGRHY_28190 [Streptomyces sp. HK10]
MRRHDTDDTSRTEQALLTGYWALSGYGLRAAHALAAGHHGRASA